MSNYREQIENTVVYGALSNASQKKEYVAQDVLMKCSIDMFITPHARYMFEAMKTLSLKGKAIDLIEVYFMLKNGVASSMFNISTAEFAENIRGAFTFERDVVIACQKLKEEHFKSECRILAERLLTEVSRPASDASALADMSEEIADTLRKGVCEDQSSSNSWSGFIKRKEDELLNGKRLLSTPWANLNNILFGGFEDFELIVLAARPSVGKTAFALNLGNHVCSLGGTVAFVSLEVDNVQIRSRSASSVLKIPYGSFRQGLNREELEVLNRNVDVMESLDLEIFDDVNYTVAKIRAEVKRLMSKKDVRLIAIDYLQLMKPTNPKEVREQQVATISRELKKLGKELGIPILLLAQLNRDLEKEKRRPRMSDLRESGAIEQDADVIIFLHTPVPNADKEAKPVEAIVAKGRSSGVGIANLVFNGKYQTFSQDLECHYKQAAVDMKPSNEGL